MKRKGLLTVFALCFSLLINGCFFAGAAETEEYETRMLDGLTENTNAVTVYDITNDKMIYSKNAGERIAVASTTKLATCLTALKYADPEDIFAVGTEQELVKPNSSVCGLYASQNHKLKLKTLIAGMLLPSGNDAAYTVAVNVARKQSGNAEMTDEQAVEYFCLLVNEFCREIGCKDTNFISPEGWDDPEHYSTAEDMTIIALEAVKNETISTIAATQGRTFWFASGHNIFWENTNQLLDPESQYYCPYAKGLKTGTTADAGKCLISYTEYDGNQLLITVFGAEETDSDENTDARYEITLGILNLILFPPVPGDVDISGGVTAADARIVLRASVGLESITEVLLERGDTDKDSALTAADARKILRVSVGLESF